MKPPFKPLSGGPADFVKIGLPAASTGKLEAVVAYVKERPDFLHRRGPHGRTLIWEAARKGKTDLVRWLHSNGADALAPGCYYSEISVELTPWGVATARKKSKTAAFLDSVGCGLERSAASFLGHLDVLQKAFAADPAAIVAPIANQSEGQGYGPLHYAVAGNQWRTVQWLFSQGVRPEPEGDRLVEWSLGFSEPDILCALLDLGVKPRPGDINEACEEPLWQAVLRRYGYVWNPNMPDRLGFPPLVEACRGNHNDPEDLERIQSLIQAGAKVDITDHKGKTAMHRAGQAGFSEAIKALARHGADPNAVDRNGETPIFDAVRAVRVKAIETLILLGASRQQENRLGQTPEFLANRIKSKPTQAAVLSALLQGGNRN